MRAQGRPGAPAPPLSVMLPHLALAKRTPAMASTATNASPPSTPAVFAASPSATATQPSTVWPAARRFLAGYFSGCALVLAGHPFDTIKVRIQTEGRGGRFNGPLDALMQTVRGEGTRGLYRGVTPPLLMTGGINFLLFGMQGVAVDNVRRYNAATAAAQGRAYDMAAPATPGEVAMAAVGTGAVISVVVTPMEGVKARLQVQGMAKGSAKAAASLTANVPHYDGPIDCVRKVLRTTGLFRGLYAGWVTTVLCRMSNYAYFGTYAVMSKLLNPEGGKMGLGTAVMAGSVTGVAYWLSCYPLDVLKNRMQAVADVRPPVYKSLRHAATELYAAEGARGFFVGFAPCLLRAVPANAACFLAYEAVLKVLPEEL